MHQPPVLPRLPGASRPVRLSRVWRWVIGVLIALPLLAALAVVTYYVVENVRGRRSWVAFRQEWEANGENFKRSTNAFSQSLTDQDNIFSASPADAWFRRTAGKTMPAGRQGEAGFWPSQLPTRLAEWHRLFVIEPPPRSYGRRAVAPRTNSTPAEEILKSLAPHEVSLAELSSLLIRRPRGRLTIGENGLGDGSRPGFLNFTTIASALAVRASAHLALSNSPAAFEDALTILRLADTLREEPYLIPSVMRATLIGQAIQPVWDGCAAGRWTDAQLAAFQKAFSAFDVAEDLGRAMRHDRALVLRLLDESPRLAFAHVSVNDWGGDNENGAKALAFLSSIVPSGWMHRNRVAYCGILQNRLAHIDAAKREPPPRDEPLPENEAFWRGRPGPYTLLSVMALQAAYRAGSVGVNTQVALGEVVVACGLERHRLATGALPESLAQLVPAYLAALPVGGQAVVYERLPEAQFALRAFERVDNYGFEKISDDEAARRDRPSWRYPNRR